jgi:hypothetical protein
VAYTDFPTLGVRVTTWVYLRQEGDRYFFYEWLDFFRWKKLLKGQSEKPQLVVFTPDRHNERGELEFRDLVSIKELVSAISLQCAGNVDPAP